MNDKQNETDLLALLNTAIENLQTVNQIAQATVPHIFHIDVESAKFVMHSGKPLDDFSYLIRSFSRAFRKEMQKKKRRIHQELINSIEYIKKHYRIIQKLKRGNQEEKKWSKQALDTINCYNGALRDAKHGHHSFKRKLLQFLYDHAKISLIDEEIRERLVDIPNEIFLKFDSISEYDDVTMEKIATGLKEGKIVKFSKTERDIFCMKGITLAEKTKIPSELRRDLSELMSIAPITAMEMPGDESTSVISMVQMLTPFPGEVITVQGQFKRSDQRAVKSVPDPGSFRISTIVTQTGFPHPSQYSGWAMSNHLIPDHPLRLDLLPRFQALQKIKKKIASDLLPGKRLNLKAKELLRLKKEAFEEKDDQLIELHKKLSFKIIKESPYPEKGEKSYQEQMDNFYNRLSSHPSPFDFLSQTHHLINKFFVESLYEKLYHEWQDKQNPALHRGVPKERYQHCSKILQEALLHASHEVEAQLKQPQTKVEEATLRFILLQGRVIGRAATSLYLQHFSEKIGFPPPLLKHFEQILQTCCFRQVIAFRKELEMDFSIGEKEIKRNLQDNLFRFLNEDLALFGRDESFEEPAAKISHELERYYNSRYAYQSHLKQKRKF